MEDFFKQFQHNLDNRPEPPFEEKDWQDLEKKLNKLSTNRSLAAAWWWWPALLFVLLGANIFFFVELELAKKKISALSLQKSTLIRQTDTVYITKVVYRRDTVYQRSATQLAPVFYSNTLLRNIYANTNPIDSKAAIAEQLNNPAPADALHFNQPPKAITNLAEIQSGHLFLGASNSQLISEVPLITPANLQSVAIKRQVFEDLRFEPSVHKNKKTLRQRLYAMRPKKYQVGIVSGLAQPFAQELTYQPAFSVGIESVAEFSSSLGLWINGTYTSMRFEAERMDEKLGVPAVAPPTDNFEFVKAEAPQPFFQLAAGLQYQMPGRQKLHPAFGVGYGLVFLKPYELSYDFRDNDLDIEWIFEKTINRSQHNTGYLLLRAGFEYQLPRHWNLQLWANYRNPLLKKENNAPAMLGIHIGCARRL